MKRFHLLMVITLLPFLLVGCINQNNDNNGDDGKINNPPQPAKLQIEDYFPIKENVKYVYEGKGNEYASYVMYIDYTSGNKVQQRVNNGGTESVKIIESRDGKLIRTLLKGEVYYRENLLNRTGEEEVLLMEPLKAGNSWTLNDSRLRRISNISADVKTPSGNYKAIEVVTEGDNGKTIDYYAKNIGLVKSVFIYEETEITSSLRKIEEDVTLVQNITFFYPNINDGKIYSIDKKISFRTNDITRQVLAKAYKDPVNDLGQVFSENTKINSLYLNKDGMVYIDLNEAFLKEMNAGAGYEAMILQSIANTFGKYYGVKRIILTIDNEPYESGHIIMEKGEYLEIKLV